MKYIKIIATVTLLITGSGSALAQDNPESAKWPPAGFTAFDLVLPQTKEARASATKLLDDAGLGWAAKYLVVLSSDVKPRPGNGLWASQVTSISGKKITVAMANSRVTCTQNECAWLVFVNGIFNTKLDACDLIGRAAISETEDKLRICDTIVDFN